MLIGTHDGTLREVRRVDLHGTPFYDLLVEHDGGAQPQRARVSAESIYPNPQPGDAIRITYLMGVVTGVELRAR